SDNIEPADIVYLVNQLRGLSTGAVGFRSVPGNPYATVFVPGVGNRDVVELEPQARELFRRLRDGRPPGKLGLAPPPTPPSHAVIGVRGVDAGAGPVADRVKSLLDIAGFLTNPVTTTNDTGVTATSIVFAPTEAGKATADVVKGYLGGSVPEVHSPP